MIYRDMMTEIGAAHNFRIYRVVRLLHDLKVIGDLELIRHEEVIYERAPIGLNIDWYNYRIVVGPNEVIQF